MKFVIFFHHNIFEVTSNVMHMKFVICVHQNDIEPLYNVKIVIWLLNNDYEFIFKVITMLHLGCVVR
jgi:hypothetical protein